MKTRKLLSILVTLAMVVSMIPAFGVTVSAAELEMPIGYWDGDTIKWKAVSGAESYQLAMMQYFEGESSIPFWATVDVDDDGSVKDSSEALIVFGMNTKKIADLVSFNKSTGFYSINYTQLININSFGQYNFRLQAKKDPKIEGSTVIRN